MVGSKSSSLISLHRQFYHHLHPDDVFGWDSSPLPGDGSWSEDASGQHWCVEGHQPLDRWCRVYKLHGEEPWAAQAYPLHPIPILTLILEWVRSLQLPSPPSNPCLVPGPSLPPQPAPPWPLGVLPQWLALECGHCLDPLLLESVLPVSCSLGEVSLTGERQWLW